MHCFTTPPIQITSGSAHHAFTSCAFWRGRCYIAYREADTHNPSPGSLIQIRHGVAPYDTFARGETFYLHTQNADLRDPRLLATEDALYCVIGAYLPAYPRTTISPRASDNLLQSFLTYTEDGNTWSPLTPIYRPQYWIWSILPMRHYFAAAAYHTGQPGESSSIHLLFGYSPLHFQPSGVMYDGALLEHDPSRPGRPYRYPHILAAEPVLYQPTPDTLGCAMRSEDGDKMMLIGVARHPYQDWRWWNTKRMIHPSAIIATPHGFLLAGRELVKGTTDWSLYTSLFHLEGETLTRVARLPSANDTGYAGLCKTPDESTWLCSYYSQHTTPTPYGQPLPGAHVFVSTFTLSA